MEFTEYTIACWQCHDEPNGYILLRCQGTTCERQKAHGPHYFTIKCPCWLKRHAERIQKYAEEAMANGRSVHPNFYALTAVMQSRYVWANAKTLNAQEAEANERRLRLPV